MQEEIVEVTQFILYERIADVFPVPQFRSKLWESCSFFHRSGSAASWCRSWSATATEYAENVEVTQLALNAQTVQIVCHRSWRKSRSLQLARWLR